jgi:4'-phosphopantetheinyl transferase EntD
LTSGLPKNASSAYIHGMTPKEFADSLHAALSAIVPKRCTSAVGVICSEALDALSESERAHIADWSPHRQMEFASGRVCARRALDELGVGLAALPADAEGVPVWPEGSTGSIAHSRGLVAAVASTMHVRRLIGLDLEKTNRLSEAAMRRVVHPLEHAFVGRDQVRGSVLFSLKEAFYKAQYPRWRTTGNFDHLSLDVNLEAGTARITAMDARFAPELKDLHLAFRMVGDYVVSLVWSK